MSTAQARMIHCDLMPAVVIAATNLMPALQERLAGEGDLLTFADTEPIQALQAILEQRPSLIVLERLFAATPRGAALINRIKTDPAARQTPRSGSCRTPATTRDRSSKPCKVDAPPRQTGAGQRSRTADERRGAPAEPATRPLDWHGTRRARALPGPRRASRSRSMAIPRASSISRLSACRCCRRRSCGRIRRCGSAFRTTTS